MSSPLLGDLQAVFDVVANTLPAAGVDCLLVGGFAVNHYGYSRSTLDIDFMIVSDKTATRCGTRWRRRASQVARFTRV